MQSITTVFSATHYFTGKGDRIEITGAGQASADLAKRHYPGHKIVIEGFMINGKFHALDTRNNFNR